MRSAALGLSALLFAGACAQVLGLEDAELDPLINPLCDEYCATVLANCTGQFAVYTSENTCKPVCRALPPGQPGDTTGNSIQCRLAQAKGAAGEPETHCAEAGPGGNDHCGSNCEAFCLVLQAACSADFARVYENRQDVCQQACATLTDTKDFDVSQNKGPDSMNCRLYHVSAAANEVFPHCKHAVGEELCVPGTGGGGGTGGAGGN